MINEGVCMECRPPALRLAPYLPCHVQRYHAWLTEPALLAATASEPLSVEEERENQDSWLRSMEKLTFILTVPVSRLGTAEGDASADGDRLAALHPVDADAPRYELQGGDDNNGSSSGGGGDGLPVRYVPAGVVDAFTGEPVAEPPPPPPAAAATENESHVMVGDCNLFLLDSDEIDTVADDGAIITASAAADNSSNSAAEHPVPGEGPRRRVFEVEVMVAEALARRMGLAQLAVRMMMQYALQVLGATHFVVKVLDDNEASLRLFADRLGFVEFKRVRVFGEVHLVRCLATESAREAWRRECGRQYLCAPFTAAMRRATATL